MCDRNSGTGIVLPQWKHPSRNSSLLSESLSLLSLSSTCKRGTPQLLFYQPRPTPCMLYIIVTSWFIHCPYLYYLKNIHEASSLEDEQGHSGLVR